MSEVLPIKAVVSSSSSTKTVLSHDAVSKAICGWLSEMLDIRIEDSDAVKPMHAFEVDSLVALEIRGWFQESMRADVAVFDISSNMTIDGLVGKVVNDHGKS